MLFLVCFSFLKSFIYLCIFFCEESWIENMDDDSAEDNDDVALVLMIMRQKKNVIWE